MMKGKSSKKTPTLSISDPGGETQKMFKDGMEKWKSVLHLNELKSMASYIRLIARHQDISMEAIAKSRSQQSDRVTDSSRPIAVGAEVNS